MASGMRKCSSIFYFWGMVFKSCETWWAKLSGTVLSFSCWEFYWLLVYLVFLSVNDLFLGFEGTEFRDQRQRILWNWESKDIRSRWHTWHSLFETRLCLLGPKSILLGITQKWLLARLDEQEASHYCLLMVLAYLVVVFLTKPLWKSTLAPYHLTLIWQ